LIRSCIKQLCDI